MNTTFFNKLLIKNTSDSYLPAADGLRAFSMLGIMWYHIWQQSWLEPSFTVLSREFNFNYLVRSGYLFVDIFMLLSAFLLFLPYAKSAVNAQNCPSMLRFYKKRAARVLPSYYLAVLVFFAVACASGAYYNGAQMKKDLLTHLSFTHVFYADTYLFTQLNAALWTVSIEVQFYLLFPFLARAFKKLPLLTYCAMVAVAFFFRRCSIEKANDTAIFINQLPAMMDIFANGMLFSYAYVSLSGKVNGDKVFALISTIAAAYILYLIYGLFRAQTQEVGAEMIRLGQLKRRYPFSILTGFLLLFLSFSIRPVQFLFGNRFMRFLSKISYQAYIWHGMIALWLKKLRIPAYEALENPQMNNEPVWQVRYTAVCFLSALALSALLTYLFEKPMEKLIMEMGRRRKARRS